MNGHADVKLDEATYTQWNETCALALRQILIQYQERLGRGLDSDITREKKQAVEYLLPLLDDKRSPQDKMNHFLTADNNFQAVIEEKIAVINKERGGFQGVGVKKADVIKALDEFKQSVIHVKKIQENIKWFLSQYLTQLNDAISVKQREPKNKKLPTSYSLGNLVAQQKALDFLKKKYFPDRSQPRFCLQEMRESLELKINELDTRHEMHLISCEARERAASMEDDVRSLTSVKSGRDDKEYDYKAARKEYLANDTRTIREVLSVVVDRFSRRNFFTRMKSPMEQLSALLVPAGLNLDTKQAPAPLDPL